VTTSHPALTLALALAAALAGPRAAVADRSRATSDEAVTLRVMTFNIRTAEGRDGDDSWPNRKHLVAETIGRHDPDVLGLQEVLAEQTAFLEGELPQYRWLGVDRGLNGGQGLSEAVPIFYRHAALVPIESGTFWLGSPPGGISANEDRPNGDTRRGRGSRIVTWARFHHLESGRQVYVYNTHFTLREGQTQLESAARINDAVASLPSGSAVVVMGDFNAYAGSSETWRVATSQGLLDAWDIARERLGPPLTSNGFGPPPDWGEGRIDWILVRGSIVVPSIETIVHSASGRYPSDHYPVLATLRLDPS